MKIACTVLRGEGASNRSDLPDQQQGYGRKIKTIESFYQYNGKEMNDEFGLDLVDYGARWYDAKIGRFHVIDRFAEKYYEFGGYHYVANNPINSIDINGDSIYVAIDGYNYLYNNGQLFCGGDVFTPQEGTFGNTLLNALNSIASGGNFGRKLISTVASDANHDIQIREIESY